MRIKREVYRALLSAFPTVPPETGAILGTKNGIITRYAFDVGRVVRDAAIYVPEVDKLNGIIEDWAKDGVWFGGLAHSHPANQTTLSSADKEYIGIIMKAMPASIPKLFFPLVFPGRQIISFVATKQTMGIELLPDDIIII